MKTLIATAFITTAAHGTGTLCTFESLPAPTFTQFNTPETGFWLDPLSSYQGFNFTSSYAQYGNVYDIFNNQWAYYDLVGGPGWGGYDEAIIGDRAIFTPWGSNAAYNYRINRNELWRLNSLEITSIWHTMPVFIEGYRYGELVFTYTAMLNVAQRVTLNISSDNITEIKVYGNLPGILGNQIAIDNIEYTVVPAPSALAMLAVAGVVGRRGRRR